MTDAHSDQIERNCTMIVNMTRIAKKFSGSSKPMDIDTVNNAKERIEWCKQDNARLTK